MFGMYVYIYFKADKYSKSIIVVIIVIIIIIFEERKSSLMWSN